MNITKFLEYIEEKRTSNEPLNESISLSINLSTLSDESYNKLRNLFQYTDFNTTSLQLHFGDMRLNSPQTHSSETIFSVHIDDFFTMDGSLINKLSQLINIVHGLTTLQLHQNHLYAWRESQWVRLAQLLEPLTSYRLVDISHNRVATLTESQWHLFSPILANLLAKNTNILLVKEGNIRESSTIIQQRILYERECKNPSDEVLEQITTDKNEIIALLQKTCPAEHVIYSEVMSHIQINPESFLTRLNHLLKTWMPHVVSPYETHEWLSDSIMARSIQPILSERLTQPHYLALLAGDKHFFETNAIHFDEKIALQSFDFGCFLGEIDIVHHLWNLFPQYTPNKQYDLIEYACYSNKPQWILNFIEQYQVNINQSNDKYTLWSQITLNVPEIRTILENLSWIKKEKKPLYTMRDYQSFSACSNLARKMIHPTIEAQKKSLSQELHKIKETERSIKIRKTQRKPIEAETGFGTYDEHLVFLTEKKQELEKQLQDLDSSFTSLTR